MRNRFLLLAGIAALIAGTAAGAWFLVLIYRSETNMDTTDDLTRLPEGLPVPVDDGACKHLMGLNVPSVSLHTTIGREVRLDEISQQQRVVVYCYPLTGRPSVPLPNGWDAIPGARGCTPEACSFRDHYADLKQLGSEVFGLSTQTSDYQREAIERLHLPFELLSDEKLSFTHALQLPTFEVDGMILIKRLTLVLKGGKVEKVFYPVFPPARHAQEVVEWVKRHG
jgi:peroxiredoxin